MGSSLVRAVYPELFLWYNIYANKNMSIEKRKVSSRSTAEVRARVRALLEKRFLPEYQRTQKVSREKLVSTAKAVGEGLVVRKSPRKQPRTPTSSVSIGAPPSDREAVNIAESASEKPKLPEVQVEETAFVGDSLTVGMRPHIEGAVKLYRGAKGMKWMRRKFNRFLAEKRTGQHSTVKRVVIMGGFNDISSTRGANYVIRNLKYMYRSARAAGLSVVGCTIPDWDYHKLHGIWVRRWRKKGWGRTKGVYPYSPEQLKAQTDKVNRWIMAHADVGVETHHGEFQRSRDGIHRTRRGYKDLAAHVKRVGNIADKRVTV